MAVREKAPCGRIRVFYQLVHEIWRRSSQSAVNMIFDYGQNFVKHNHKPNDNLLLYNYHKGKKILLSFKIHFRKMRVGE